MHEQERMGSRIESVGHLEWQSLVEDLINNVDDLLGEVLQIEDWRISIETDGMKLVAILNMGDGYFDDRFDHLVESTTLFFFLTAGIELVKRSQDVLSP